MTVINRLEQIKAAIEAIEAGNSFNGTLPGTEQALALIETAIANSAFDGTLPGAESALIALRTDIQANTNALLCVCNALRETIVYPPGDNPFLPPINLPPTTINDPIVNPPPGGEGWTLCKAAYAYIEVLAELCDDIATLSGTPLWSFSTLVAALSGHTSILVGVPFHPGTALAAGFIWGIVNAFVPSLIVATFQNLASELRTNTELRSCLGSAFLSGSTTAMSTAVDNKLNDPTLALILKTLITQDMIDKFTNGFSIDGTVFFPQYDGVPSCFCEEPLLVVSEWKSGGNMTPLWSFAASTYVLKTDRVYGQIASNWGTQFAATITNQRLRTEVGSGTLRLTGFRMYLGKSLVPLGDGTKSLHLKVKLNDDVTTETLLIATPNDNEWYEWSGDVLLAPDAADVIITLQGVHNGFSTAGGIDIYMTEIYGAMIP